MLEMDQPSTPLLRETVVWAVGVSNSLNSDEIRIFHYYDIVIIEEYETLRLC